jgi:hypothetical protein
MRDNNTIIHDECNSIKFTINLPDHCTEGDLQSVKGALYNAATFYIDWEKLYNRTSDTISIPGIILLTIANELK